MNETTSSPPLTEIGRYRIQGEIGSGGMGVVYRALDRDLGRVVAIKMLKPRSASTTDRERFLREARTAAKLQHPCIVPIHEIGMLGDRPYLVMDFIAGYTLADLLAAGRRGGQAGAGAAPPPASGNPTVDDLPQPGTDSGQAASVIGGGESPTRAQPPDRPAPSPGAAPGDPIRVVALPDEVPRLSQRVSLEILRDVCLALEHAHSHGIIHRDIKPSNILIDKASRRPYLTDFGLAREVLDPERITLSGTIVGTPQYMAPEIATGGDEQLTSAVDVYGLGAVLYEILADRPPHDGRSAVEVVYKVIHEDAAPPSRHNPRTHRDLETIVMRCLDKDPRRRYPTARDLADELGRFLAGEPILARPAGAMTRVFRRVSRHKPVAAALGFALFVLAASLALRLDDAVQRRRAAGAALREGIRRLESGDTEGAVQTLADASALARTDVEIERWLQTARQRQHERRRADLEQARQAALAEQAARRAAALPHYGKGEELRGKAAVLVLHGDLAARQAYLENAVEAYGRAVEQDPGFAEAFTGRGRVHVELGDARRAHEDFRTAVRLRPEFTEAYLGRLQLLTEEYEALWMKTGRVTSADIGSMSSLPDLTGDPDAEAIKRIIDEDIRTVLALGVKPEETRYFEGWLLRNAGDREGARKAFEEAITLWKYYAPGYEGRACMRLLLGDPDLDGIQRDLD